MSDKALQEQVERVREKIAQLLHQVEIDALAELDKKPPRRWEELEDDEKAYWYMRADQTKAKLSELGLVLLHPDQHPVITGLEGTYRRVCKLTGEPLEG